MPDIHPPSPPPQLEAAESWSERGLGGNAQRKFFHWLIRHGGKRRGYHMANIVAFWYVLFYPSIRRRCRFYLARRFSDHRRMPRRFLDTYQLVRNYAGTLVDAVVLEVLGPAAFHADCPDHDRLKQITASASGLVLIHAHVGSFQLGMSTLGQFSKRVSVLLIPELHTRSPLDPKVGRLIDPRQGLESVVQMTDALLEGQIVAMAGDRTIGDKQMQTGVQFLGGRVLLPILPYRLASAVGVPVAVLTAARIDGGRYTLRLARLIEVPAGLGRDPKSYAPYAQMFADCIEQFVRENPWQFYNFYDFWDATEHP